MGLKCVRMVVGFTITCAIGAHHQSHVWIARCTRYIFFW